MRGAVGSVLWVCLLLIAAACSSSTVSPPSPGGTGGGGKVGGASGVGGSAGRGPSAGRGGSAGSMETGEGGDSGEDAQGGTSGGGRGGSAGSDAGQAGAAGDGGEDPCTNGGILAGDIDARGELEVLRCVVEVRGNLWIHLGPNLPAAVPELERVTGTLTVTGSSGDRWEEAEPFELTALASVGALSVTDWSGFPNVTLPALTHVLGSVSVASNLELEAVDGELWPALHTIDGSLFIGSCWVYGGFEAELVACGTNQSLRSVELPALRRVQDIVVGDDPALETLRAPELRSVEDVHVGHCLPIYNDDLDRYGEEWCEGPTGFSELSVPALTSANDVLVRFGRMQTLAFPALETISTLEFGTTWGLTEPVDLASLRRASTLRLTGLGPGVTAPALVTAMEIDLDGALSDPLSFPALSGLRRFYVSATALSGFDCAAVLPALAADAFPNLRLSGASITSFDCSGVVAFRSLSLTGTAVSVVSLSALTSTSSLNLSGGELTSVQAPALSSGSVSVTYVQKLGALVLPALAQSDVLTLGVTGLTSLDLPALRRAGGINLMGTGASSLAFPVLEEVKQLYVVNESAAELAFPSLTTGTLEIIDNPGLTRIDLPAFAHLGTPRFGGDAVAIHKNPVLAEVVLGLSGESDQDVTIVKNPELSSLVLGAPISLRALTLEKNRKLDSVDLPVSAIGELALTNGTVVMPPGASAFSVRVYEHDGFDQAPDVWAPHSVTVRGLTTVEEGVSAANTEALTSIAFPDLVSAKRVSAHTNAALTTIEVPALGPSIVSLGFQNNAVLTRPAMPALTSVQNFYVHANVSWSQCDVEAWAASLGVTCNCEGNGACSP